MIPIVRYIDKPSGCQAQIDLCESTHCVYFLKGQGNRTYVGYSVNPFHRLRQHNGEIVGGAKKTRTGRPWQIICIVSGFPSERAALQFEWKWHRIRRKRIPAFGRTRTGRKRRGTRKGLNIIDCREALLHLFSEQWTSTSPLPFSFPLTLIWNQCDTITDEFGYVWQNQPQVCSSWVIYIGYLQKLNSEKPVLE